MDYTKYLREIGLSDKEAEIYLTLLKNGGMQATELAKKTGLKRTTVYPLVKSMIDQGVVVMYIVKNKQTFFAQPPQKIAQLFESRLKGFLDIIPQLATLEKKETQVIGMRFLDTSDDLRRFYDEATAAHPGKTLRIIGNTNTLLEAVGQEFYDHYRQDRIEKEILSQMILSADSAKVTIDDHDQLRQFKYLSPEFVFESIINIYDDQVLMINPKMTSVALVIAVPALVDVFRVFFDSLWQALPKEA